MNREFLEELLKSIVTDEAARKEMIDKIMDENGKSINASKSKIEELTQQLGLKDKESVETNKLLEDLKKASAGNEDNLNKIKSYEGQIAQLQKEKEEMAKAYKAKEAENALSLALANAKVTDVDYIAYKIKEKGELKLDDKGNIKGIEDTLKEMKTTYPGFFETEKKKEIDVKELGKGEIKAPEPKNLAEALNQKYNDAKNEL